MAMAVGQGSAFAFHGTLLKTTNPARPFLQASTVDDETKAPPRTGLAQKVLDFALTTPLWKYVLVPQARSTMAKTAESNGIPWQAAKQWIKEKMELPNISETDYHIPTYYQKEFHAYDEGNICWDAALEAEIASAAVGARNFPQFGSQGENAFRGAFDAALMEAGARVPDGGSILDMGCGSGMSTRRQARNFPKSGNSRD